ncbi:DUF4234 domain-containing protein [Frankia sp. Cj3]|uniref:DUF4234 domain-containing protein n=1 Tax=Frankia sp. Cj3 TaxID=2880976 RepID=UPI001EF596EF|nr:DUF4234 domain-containing protein [Frankia sp. Cj3]
MTDQNLSPYGQLHGDQQPCGPRRVDEHDQPRRPRPPGDRPERDGRLTSVSQPGVPQPGGPPVPGRANPGSTTPAPSGYPQPADTGIYGKRRSPFAVWLGLPLITLGIYSIIWIYKITRELNEYDQRNVIDPIRPVLAVTLGVFLIFPPFVTIWRLCAHVRQAQQAAGLPPLRTGAAFTVFLLGCGPLNLQGEINRIWDRYPGAVEGQQIPLPARP